MFFLYTRVSSYFYSYSGDVSPFCFFFSNRDIVDPSRGRHACFSFLFRVQLLCKFFLFFSKVFSSFFWLFDLSSVNIFFFVLCVCLFRQIFFFSFLSKLQVFDSVFNLGGPGAAVRVHWNVLESEFEWNVTLTHTFFSFFSIFECFKVLA